MYAAFLNNELVLATEQAKIENTNLHPVKKQYFCPKCRKRMQLIVKNHSAYFKHVSQSNNSIGEKQEHASGKKMLKEALIEANFAAQTEVTLANGQLRADVLAKANLAFEVQCAQLSRAEFRHRHLLYRQLGIKDIWIVGKRHYLKSKLKKSQYIFFRKNKQWHDYYLEIDPYYGIIRLKFNVLLEPMTDRVHYQTRTFALNGTGLTKLWCFHPKLKRYCVDPNLQKKYLQKQLTQKSIKGMQIASMLYQNHLTTDDLPIWTFKRFRPVNSLNNALSYLT